MMFELFRSVARTRLMTRITSLLLLLALLIAIFPLNHLAAAEPATLAARHPDAGIWVMYRGNNSVEDLQKPYIKGVMAYAPWNTTYKGEASFNWFNIDRELDFIINQAGKRAMLDVTAGYCPTLDWPAWMRERVASKIEPNNFGCHPLQFWDPVYIALYKIYIRALALHLAEFDANDARPTETDIIFVRAEVMAKTMENLPNGDELDEWTWQHFTPAANGRIYQTDLTQSLNFDYQAQITLAYQEELAKAYAAVGLTPPVAAAKGGNYWDAYPTLEQFVEAGVWLEQHSGEPNPQGWYYDLYRKARGGETRGASETGGKAPSALLAQYTYWEILANLHFGIEFIGIYGNNKFWPELQPKGAVNYVENRAALEFGARYAGHFRDPATSPGAWIALRGSYPEDRFGGKVFARHVWTNYEFLIKQYQPQNSVLLFSDVEIKDVVDSIVPVVMRSGEIHPAEEVAACELEFSNEECKYLWQPPERFIGEFNGIHYYTYHATDLGEVVFCAATMFCNDPTQATRTETMMWARRTNNERSLPAMYFDLDDEFARSLNGRARIRVVYLDQGHGQWSLRYDAEGRGQKRALVVQKGNTNQWKEVVVEIDDAHFGNRQVGATDLSLFSMEDDDDIFHMIEVLRVQE